METARVTDQPYNWVGVDDFGQYDAGPQDNGTQPATAGFPIITAAALCQEPDTDGNQLLGPLVLQGGRTIIVGDTGHGKTTIAMQLIRCILDQQPFCGHQGAGGGKALIIDLEQGRKSVKRALRNSALGDRADVDLVLIPDGLSLDAREDERHELERILIQGAYTIVLLDPYYKAHRADDPNAERPIVDLMRHLDRLRADYGFALILPAHPRKPAVGENGHRKLTIHDVAGSGAVTRGAEIVLGIERLNHGYARLRYLKDREGDLPIGEALGLIYNTEHGYQRDPRDLEPPKDYPAIVANVADGQWHTAKEYSDLCGDQAGEATVKKALITLTGRDEFEFAKGPPGRDVRAKCWRPKTPTLTESGGFDAHDAHDAFGVSDTKIPLTASVHPHPLGMHTDADSDLPTASNAQDADADPDDDQPF